MGTLSDARVQTLWLLPVAGILPGIPAQPTWIGRCKSGGGGVFLSIPSLSPGALLPPVRWPGAPLFPSESSQSSQVPRFQSLLGDSKEQSVKKMCFYLHASLAS